MRPSQRERVEFGANSTYSYQMSGRYQQVSVSFPPPSGYFEASTIHALHALWSASEAEGGDGEILARMQQWLSESSDDPYVRFAYLMAIASFQHWMGDSTAALQTINAADQLSLSTKFTRLVAARMRYEAGDLRGALQAVDQLRPISQRMLVDKELTRLQLLLELGDLEQARQSVRRLFALRLDSDTQFKLSDLMYQLGMQEMADRMMNRIQRRAGGRQKTLVQLMQRYSRSGELKKAAEIARQVVRRTAPSVTRNRRTSSNVHYEQALRTLVQAKEIKPLLERYEELVERSPKSTKLVNQLAAIYEAAGRRQDAQKLRIRTAEQTSNKSPQALMSAAQSLAASGAYDRACEKWIEALKGDPNLLNNATYEMREAFNEGNGWKKLVDMMFEEGIEKFASSYRIGEVAYQVMRNGDQETANRLLGGCVKAANWNAVGTIMSRMQNASNVEVTDEVAELVVEQLISKGPQTANIQFTHSTSSSGITNGVPSYVCRLVGSNPQQAQTVRQALAKRLEEDPSNDLTSRIMLCMLLVMQAEDLDKSENEAVDEQQLNTQAEGKKIAQRLISFVEPLLDSEALNSQQRQALWALASFIVEEEGDLELALRINTRAAEAFSETTQSTSWSIGASPMGLQITLYEKLDRQSEAVEALTAAMRSLEIDPRQNQYNAGYGDYQYINSMSSIAERMLKLQRPIEAMIAYEKSYGNPELVASSKSWGGNLRQQGERQLSRIRKLIDNDSIVSAVEVATGLKEDAAGLGTFLSSLQVSGSSWADREVNVFLETILNLDEANEDVIAARLEELRQLSQAWEETSAKSLNEIVCRLVVASMLAAHADNQDGTEPVELCLAELDQWLQDHPVPSEADATATEASVAESDVENSQDARYQRELLLAVAARHLPENTSQENVKQVSRLQETLLSRAIQAALDSQQEQLAVGLRCQLASQTAARDRELAREMFQQVLNELLPQKESATNSNND